MDILSLCRRMVMLFFCMACGFCAAKGGVMDTQSNKKLSALVVNVANPMQILASGTDGGAPGSRPADAPAGGADRADLSCADRPELPGRAAAARQGRERGLYRFMFIFSNTGFLAIPSSSLCLAAARRFTSRSSCCFSSSSAGATAQV